MPWPRGPAVAWPALRSLAVAFGARRSALAAKRRAAVPKRITHTRVPHPLPSPFSWRTHVTLGGVTG